MVIAAVVEETNNNVQSPAALTRSLFRRVFVLLLAPCFVLTHRMWQTATVASFSYPADASSASLKLFAAVANNNHQPSSLRRVRTNSNGGGTTTTMATTTTTSTTTTTNNVSILEQQQPIFLLYISFASPLLHSQQQTIHSFRVLEEDHYNKKSNSQSKTCHEQFWQLYQAKRSHEAHELPCWKRVQEKINLHYEAQQQQQDDDDDGATTSTSNKAMRHLLYHVLRKTRRSFFGTPCCKHGYCATSTRWWWRYNSSRLPNTCCA